MTIKEATDRLKRISKQASDFVKSSPSHYWSDIYRKDAEALEMAIEALSKTEPQTCCGYDVNKLILFATACRQQGVENGDLKAFANNCIFAWNVMSGEFAKTIEDIMRGQSDE